jgi:hypothetical protein
MISLNLLFGSAAAMVLLMALVVGWWAGYSAGRARREQDREIDKHAGYLAGVRAERAAQAREPLWLEDDGEQWKRGGRS